MFITTAAVASILEPFCKAHHTDPKKSTLTQNSTDAIVNRLTIIIDVNEINNCLLRCTITVHYTVHQLIICVSHINRPLFLYPSHPHHVLLRLTSAYAVLPFRDTYMHLSIASPNIRPRRSALRVVGVKPPRGRRQYKLSKKGRTSETHVFFFFRCHFRHTRRTSIYIYLITRIL